MTTPGSHNDAYASTYHRMFFANRKRGLPLDKCPDNDSHNVDVIDGLIMPVPVILGTVLSDEGRSAEVAQESVRVTRRSRKVEDYVPKLTWMLRSVLGGRK